MSRFGARLEASYRAICEYDACFCLLGGLQREFVSYVSSDVFC